MKRNTQHLYESIIDNIDKELKYMLNEQIDEQTADFDPKKICNKILKSPDNVTEDEIHYMNTLSNIANVGSNRIYLDKIVKFYSEKFPNDSMNWLNVSQITDMSKLFSGANPTNTNKYNGDISKWNVSNVINMSELFLCSVFNNDISHWNVSKVENMERMFECSKFDQDISQWDVSSVTTMLGMFKDSEFDQDISQWDISSVQNMSWMFDNSEFDHDISNWDMIFVKNLIGVFKNSILSERNKPKYLRYEKKHPKVNKRTV